MYRTRVIPHIICLVTAIICSQASPAAAQGSAAADCTPPAYYTSVPQGVEIPPLDTNERPNFIVILTDDQGWDDIGLNNPEWVHTPNLDRFIKSGLLFDNFYTAPQCSPSRAMLLTGRDYARTGTLLVSTGWDEINTGETTIGKFMSASGYNTAQFGKWHNGEEAGYEPWNTGFGESWMAPNALYAQVDPIFSHNGQYVRKEGLFEETMADQLTGYLDQQTTADKPFFVYYATRAIHAGPYETAPPSASPNVRPVPPTFRAKYNNNPKYAGLSADMIDAFAFSEYLDNSLGKIFDYLDSKPELKRKTYVMIGGDNGSWLLKGDKLTDSAKQVRMPSKMMGTKSTVEEGGIRNFWAVQGPGVAAGIVNSALLQLTDIMPTVAELAGIDPSSVPHKPWDGISFADILRGSEGPSPQHRDRMVFSLIAPMCWNNNAFPKLGSNRQTQKQPIQRLLTYANGGMPSKPYTAYLKKWLPSTKVNTPGFKSCIAVRWQDYKWNGLTNKVHRLAAGSHIERPCNEVTGAEAAGIRAKLNGAALAWWQSIVAEPYSFVKVRSFIGLPGVNVTNVVATLAKDRTKGSIAIVANVTGFKQPNDRICMDVQVVEAGAYEVIVFYTSAIDATFRLSIGNYGDIVKGAATSKVFALPAQNTLRGNSIGHMQLQSSVGDADELCLTLVRSTRSGHRIFTGLENIRFIKAGSTSQLIGPDFQSAADVAVPVVDLLGSAGPDWSALRPKYNWPEGQRLMQHIYSPLSSESDET